MKLNVVQVTVPGHEYPRLMLPAPLSIGLKVQVYVEFAWYPAKVSEIHKTSVRCWVKNKWRNVSSYNVKTPLVDVTNEFHIYPPNPFR